MSEYGEMVEVSTIPLEQMHAYLVFIADGGNLPFPRYRDEVWNKQDDIPFKKYPTRGPEWERYKQGFDAVARQTFGVHPHSYPSVKQAYEAWLTANTR